MSDLTYRQLADKIAQMSDADKDCDVTVYVAVLDEYCPAIDLYATDSDVLDIGHPALRI